MIGFGFRQVDAGESSGIDLDRTVFRDSGMDAQAIDFKNIHVALVGGLHPEILRAGVEENISGSRQVHVACFLETGCGRKVADLSQRGRHGDG